MTDVPTPEMKRLIDLERAAVASFAAVRGEPYSAEAWKPWCDATWTFQKEVTAYAKRDGVGMSRYEVEMAAKAAAEERGARGVTVIGVPSDRQLHGGVGEPWTPRTG